MILGECVDVIWQVRVPFLRVFAQSSEIIPLSKLATIN